MGVRVPSHHGLSRLLDCPRYRSALWRHGTEEVSSRHDIPVDHCDGCLHLPMGLLGILSRLLEKWRSLHWGFDQLWYEGCKLLLAQAASVRRSHHTQVMAAPSWGSAVIPDIVFCFYELMFCACATMIVVGGSFERGRILPSIIFGFCWATICYCPISYWTWNANGWLFTFGALDFAGGGPVHISSGTAGLAYALVLGKRSRYGEKHIYKAHNVTVIFLGTVLIYFGWFGFNGGSALNASIRAMLALWNTNMAACTGAAGWILMDYIKKRKFSVVGGCEGIICGLVGITPAAGYVSVWCGAAIGFITAVVVHLFENVNVWLNIDDGLEVFKLHGIGGMCGAFLTGIFATASVSSLDGVTLASGGIDGNGVQIAKQLAEIAAIAGWSFTLSFIMLMILKYIPGLHLRVTDEAEMIGLDLDQFTDEVVGEWSLFTDETTGRQGSITHGVAPPGETSTPSEGTSENATEQKVEPKAA